VAAIPVKQGWLDVRHMGSSFLAAQTSGIHPSEYSFAAINLALLHFRGYEKFK
jgi:hypothetical protein